MLSLAERIITRGDLTTVTFTDAAAAQSPTAPHPIRLVSAGVCYVLAVPFELIVLWSAIQVIFAGASRAFDAATLRHILGISLARGHPVPFAAFAVVSLLAAFAGAAQHLRYRRLGE